MPVIYSSGSNDYGTPPEVFGPLDDVFHFNIDLAADKKNRKCKKYFSREDDALKKGWTGYKAFLNPPYNDKLFRLDKWVTKAIEETRKNFETLVVMLVKNEPTTKWGRFAWGYADIAMLWKDRIAFIGAKTGAVFSNAVFVFGSTEYWNNHNLEVTCEKLGDYGIVVNLHREAVWLPEGCQL